MPESGVDGTVFISYHSSDRNSARRIAGDLQQRGIEVWLDEERILVGDSIHSKVGCALNSSRFVVMLMSNNSFQSPWVEAEINSALAREKHSGLTILLPLLIGPTAVEHLPPLLRDRHFGSLFPSYAEGLSSLELAIRGHAARSGPIVQM
jgi:hypothetical protein